MKTPRSCSDSDEGLGLQSAATLKAPEVAERRGLGETGGWEWAEHCRSTTGKRVVVSLCAFTVPSLRIVAASSQPCHRRAVVGTTRTTRRRRRDDDYLSSRRRECAGCRCITGASHRPAQVRGTRCSRETRRDDNPTTRDDDDDATTRRRRRRLEPVSAGTRMTRRCEATGGLRIEVGTDDTTENLSGKKSSAVPDADCGVHGSCTRCPSNERRESQARVGQELASTNLTDHAATDRGASCCAHLGSMTYANARKGLDL